MSNVLEALQARGFFQQCTDFEKLSALMDKEAVTFYVGIDPTGSSLHVGHMVPLFAMAQLQRAGHQPLVIVGAGTALIGDPSGKTEMRTIQTLEQIEKNAEAIKTQIGKIVDFNTGQALMLNNYDWLGGLNYIGFLRDIGRHFSVNRMLSFETYKARLEKGLSFIEFNYQLLQAYDFLKLNQNYNCKLQIGGDDQWGNIVAGVDLTRRVAGQEVFGLTFPLVTRSDGKKMGKTEKGAVYLDPDMFSPYDYYQYWRNIADADVKRFLQLFTFLSDEKIEELGALKGNEINVAKEVLAFEQTALIHGKEEAEKAQAGARAAFTKNGDAAAIPSIIISSEKINQGINVLDLFCQTGLCASKSEARRLIQQGGAMVNEEKITDIDTIIESKMVRDNELLLKAGKKRYFRVVVS